MTFRRAPTLVVMFLLALAAGAAFIGARAVEGFGDYRPPGVAGAVERELAARLADDGLPMPQRYDALFGYFLHGFVAHLTDDGARVQYPGLPSIHGYSVNGLEGFARTAPLLAAWIRSGRSPRVRDPETGAEVDLVALLKQGILAGTDPAATGYWGRMGDRDQRVVEAADIARVLWLTRTQLWDTLSPVERERVATWLRQVNGVALWPNNWRLFPVVVNLALASLGAEPAPDTRRYDEFKRDYLGHGWFADSSRGADFYNAWGIGYDLLWIRLLRPEFDRAFIEQVLVESAGLTSHLISPQGIPILGRSVCYRTAVPAPLLAQLWVDDSPEAAGLARRSLDAVWRHFVAHGALADGGLTQGYHGTDARVVDFYTGAGSCHWGLRSLVLAYIQPPGAALWTAPPRLLPVEAGDFRLDLPALGWIVEGRRETGEIVIRVPANKTPTPALQPQSAFARLAEPVLRRPLRPANGAAKYGASRYSSREAFPLSP
jgi:hypothetical protein